MAVAAMLLLVDVSSSTALLLSALPCSRSDDDTYTSVEFVLCVAHVHLWDVVDRAAAFRLRSKTRALANIARTTTTGGKFTVGRLALDTFAYYAAIRVGSAVRANVASAWSGQRWLEEVKCGAPAWLIFLPPRPVE